MPSAPAYQDANGRWHIDIDVDDRRGVVRAHHLSAPTRFEAVGLARDTLARARPPVVAYWLRGSIIFLAFVLTVLAVLRFEPFDAPTASERVATLGTGPNPTALPTPKKATKTASSKASRTSAPANGATTSTMAGGHSGTSSGNLLATTQVTSYLATRTGNITVALYNTLTGKTYLYRPGVAQTTASIIKVDILATLLRQAQVAGEPLSDDSSDLATTMIENSNDNSAQKLWAKVGASVGVGAFDSLAGLSDTDLNRFGYWGLSTTTAADQLAVLKAVVYPNDILDTTARDYELRLMENVESDQQWGVSGGVPSGVTVAIKDGWDPLDNDTTWQVNSIGWIDGQGRNYLLAVLTTGESTESYGIQTIQGISTLVWSELAPATAR